MRLRQRDRDRNRDTDSDTSRQAGRQACRQRQREKVMTEYDQSSNTTGAVTLELAWARVQEDTQN